jgi:hypothetical protein
MPIKSPQAAQQIGCGYYRLMSLIRDGRLTPPSKDSSGDYIWGPEDVERARFALRIDRRLKKYRGPREVVRE